MKSDLIVFAAIIAVSCVAETAFCQENPLGSPLVPPSSGKRGLTKRRPEPFESNGNLIVTGNVSGGKHFRGVVPYNSQSQFSSATDSSLLGSGSLNSFIRRSSGTSYSSRGQTGRTQPYYLPSQTVTSLKRGSKSGLSSPHVTFKGGTGKFALPLLPTSDLTSYRRKRPMSISAQELEKVIMRQLHSDDIKADLDKALTEQMLKDETERLIDETLRPILPVEPIKKTDQLEEEIEEEPKQVEEELFELAEPVRPGEKKGKRRAQKDKPAEEEEAGEKAPELILEEMLDKVDHAKAAELRGSHKTFKSYAAAKFDHYVQAGNEYMQQQKYYRAADAFTLAEIYDNESLLPVIGKGHALFAAGEYMSSSFFLTSVIARSPQFLEQDIDLETILGGKDVIETRLVDIVNWQLKSGAGELAFLGSYVLYRIDRLNEAEMAIAEALKEMPDNVAAKALADAIESAISQPR